MFIPASLCFRRWLYGSIQCISEPTASNETIDLQFFDAEDEGRTEDPTQKKKQDAMEDGMFPITEEFPDGLTMGLGFFIVWFFGGWMIQELIQFTEDLLTLKTFDTVTPGNIHSLIVEMIWINVKIGGPVAFAAILGGTSGYIVQTGGRWSTSQLTFDWSNLQPSLSNLWEGDFMSKKSLWGFGKSLLKLVIIGFVAYEVIVSDFDRLLMLIHVPVTNSVVFVTRMAFEIIFKAILLLLLISPIDYWFEHEQWFDQLKMKPEEVEDEQKQREGDPEVKKKQQEKMQEMADQRMMEEVPEADVVITNPTHYAVALKYEEDYMKAPSVVAKGTGMVAQRIRQIARENQIPIYEIPLLARTLYQFDLNEEIPASLYETVATVLAWVHQQREQVPESEREAVEKRVEGLNIATG